MDSLVLGRYVVRAFNISTKVPRRCPMRLTLQADLTPSDSELQPMTLQISMDGAPKTSSWAPDVLPLLLSLDGQRHVAEIARQGNQSPEELKPILLALLRQGYIEWVEKE